MSESAVVNDPNKHPFQVTTHITNKDNELIAWDAVRERIHVPAGGKASPETLTVTEAAVEFKIDRQAIYHRARRHGWRTLTTNEKKLLIKKTRNWGKSAEEHREAAFDIAHASVKKFKARTPKSFHDLDIADKIARRAAGLDNAEVIQQTLVHINEAIEEHAEVIEADSSKLPDQEAVVEDAEVASIEDTESSTQLTAP
jgi:predicted DNA-binding protein YlxM (UPF0122 family)